MCYVFKECVKVKEARSNGRIWARAKDLRVVCVGARQPEEINVIFVK